MRYMPQQTFNVIVYHTAAVELDGRDTRAFLEKIAQDYSRMYRNKNLSESAQLGSEATQKLVKKFLSVGESEQEKDALCDVFRELSKVALDYLPDGRRTRRFLRGSLFYWAWSDYPNRHILAGVHAVNYLMRLQEGVIPRHK